MWKVFRSLQLSFTISRNGHSRRTPLVTYRATQTPKCNANETSLWKDPGRKSSGRDYSTKLPDVPTAPFPDEPTGPSMKTAVPGPKGKELVQQMDKYQESRTPHLFVDYTKSKGNYIVDADGNVLLDVLCSIASHSVGYNNPALIAAARSDEWVTALINRPATGMEPSALWPSLLQKSIMSVAPKGLDQIFTAMCGTCANETAYKAVFMAHQHKKRGGKAFSEEELNTCMKNQPPGSPDLAILSFKGGFHGRLFGSLTTTRSKSIHKVDIPAFNWPEAPFPKLKYPLKDFEAENKQEEERCLAEVSRIIASDKKRIAGMIIEPIQAEGGDNHASPEFFRRLRKIAQDNDIYFIVDEVQTGVGSTGKFWAHEHWNLPTPPDVVSFSKKMQAAGFFHTLPLRASQPYRNFNTWLGDPVRLLQAGVIIKEIKDKNLLQTVQITGDYLKAGLMDVQKRFPQHVSNVRGIGTFLAFDLPSPDAQMKLLGTLRQKGVEATGSGNQSIRLRPMLIFAPKHAAQFLDILSTSLKTL